MSGGGNARGGGAVRGGGSGDGEAGDARERRVRPREARTLSPFTRDDSADMVAVGGCRRPRATESVDGVRRKPTFAFRSVDSGFDITKTFKWDIPSALHCMLGRGVLCAFPVRFLPRTAPVPKLTRRMSVGADANQPEVHANKMARVEDTLRVKKISEHAVLPVRGSEGAAGYDLASAYECGTSRSRASVLAGETRARRGRDARRPRAFARPTPRRREIAPDATARRFQTLQNVSTRNVPFTRDWVRTTDDADEPDGGADRLPSHLPFPSH